MILWMYYFMFIVFSVLNKSILLKAKIKDVILTLNTEWQCCMCWMIFFFYMTNSWSLYNVFNQRHLIYLSQKHGHNRGWGCDVTVLASRWLMGLSLHTVIPLYICCVRNLFTRFAVSMLNLHLNMPAYLFYSRRKQYLKKGLRFKLK